MIIKLILQFLIGIAVGIYGYLPPGYINLGLMQIAGIAHRNAFWKLILIISIIEIPYCFICMNSMQWIMQQAIFLSIIRWLIVIVFLVLSVWSFLDAQKPQKPIDKTMVNTDPQLKKLLLLAIFNPFQLSAWAIWGTYFIEKTWFSWTPFSIIIFSFGASLGVFVILWLYAHIGKQLINLFALNKKSLDYIVSIILLVLAIIQIIRNILY